METFAKMDKSREAFEAWKLHMLENKGSFSELDIWQAAQSRHAEEREALVEELRERNLKTLRQALKNCDVPGNYQHGIIDEFNLLSNSAQGGEDSGRVE
jgi:hypothetical protein